MRLVGPVHLAETREQARTNVEFGLRRRIDYFTSFDPAAVGDAFHADDPATALVESGQAELGDGVGLRRRVVDRTEGGL
jgi:limonene 1,2-monooxygenase